MIREFIEFALILVGPYSYSKASESMRVVVAEWQTVVRRSHVITSLVFVFFLLVMLASSGGHMEVWDDRGYFLQKIS